MLMEAVRWKHRLVRAAGAVLLALMPGCATLQPAPPATGPALWQVADADTTIFLFGTVHALPDGVAWYDERIARAFESADELTTEIDLSNQAEAAGALTEAAMLPAGQNLRALMGEDDRAAFEATLTGLGVPVDAFDAVEPWFAALNLSLLPLVQAGFDPTEGVDMVLSARAEGKQRTALETIEEQVALFDALPTEAQLTLLAAAIEAAPRASASVQAMIDSWLAGDADRLAALMNAEFDDPALYNRLLVERNGRWVEWIAQRLEQPGTVFVAVGAGHLAGAGSVQDLLEARGLTVTRVVR